MDLASLLTGGLSTLLDNIVNWFSQEKTNETNKEINQTNLDYNAAQTQAQWERDDNAHQREVADLQAAGLSPLASLSGSANGSPLGAPNPIAMEAPQIDTNQLFQAVIAQSQLNETNRHNLEMESQGRSSIKNEAAKIRNDTLKTINDIETTKLENKKVQAQIEYQTKLAKLESDKLAETVEHNKAEEYQKQLAYESEMYFREIEQQVGKNLPYKDFYDVEEFNAANQAWLEKFSQFVKTLGPTSQSQSSTTSTAETNAGGFNVLGSGGNVNTQWSDSAGQSSSENISKEQEAKLIEFYTKNPKPVFHVKKWNVNGSYKRAN